MDDVDKDQQSLKDSDNFSRHGNTCRMSWICPTYCSCL